MKIMINTLLAQGNLSIPADTAVAIREERAWQARLARRPPSYLREYDILFRVVSLWLLRRYGVTFSNQTPHCTLALLCTHHQEKHRVMGMIRARHDIKYGRVRHIASEHVHTLQTLLAAFAQGDNH